jgi:amino acid adenylation domain-containing protein
MDRSPELLAALLGIWKAGAAYLALDPLSPSERLDYILRDAAVPLVLVERKLASCLPAQSLQVLYQVLYADDLLAGQVSQKHLTERANSSAELAYVLYTSGSTGRPKGVEIRHEGLANVVRAIAEELRLRSEEVLLAHTSVSFDVFNLEMYLPLVSGGSLYVTEPRRVDHGARLIEALRESGATTMLGASSLWRLLIDSGWEGKPDLRAISGGEVLPSELANALCKRTAEVWNHYGPTEATICSTTARIDLTTPKITIGRPIANVGVHILDANLQPAAPGTTGEIYIGGAGVARGYRNRPALTADSFLADRFSHDPNARLYKTGDLGRTVEDGTLEFIGRTDNQVKIHGHRIELEEIESQILQLPGMRSAVVAAVNRGQDDQRIVAWFESESGIAVSAVKEFLRKRLPAYMLPSEIVPVASMPLNESGKVDRQSLTLSLCAAAAERPASGASDLESRLRKIWEDLLEIRPIPLTESFFDLGGDSLLATLLVTQIEVHLGEKITPDALIECPNIKSMAARLTKQENSARRTLVPLRTGGCNPPLFIVHGLGGSALLFRSLSDCMGYDRPVYAVALPSGEVRDKNEISIAALASKYVADIRQVAPSGPYCIAGHSFGAIIAFEIAAQLAQSDEDIGLLALIEGDRNLVNCVNSWEEPHPALLIKRVRAKFRSLAQKGVAEVARRRLEHVKLQRRVQLAQRTGMSEIPGRAFGAKELLVLAAREHTPSLFNGSVVLFRAQDEVRSEAESDLGWAGLCSKGLEIVDIPGGHLTIFDEPNVQVLAAALTARMKQAVSI